MAFYFFCIKYLPTYINGVGGKKSQNVLMDKQAQMKIRNIIMTR